MCVTNDPYQEEGTNSPKISRYGFSFHHQKMADKKMNLKVVFKKLMINL